MLTKVKVTKYINEGFDFITSARNNVSSLTMIVRPKHVGAF